MREVWSVGSLRPLESVGQVGSLVPSSLLTSS